MPFLQTRDSSVVDRQTFELKQDSARIGRSASSEICLDHHGISRDHAVVTYDKGTHFISDMNSRNGTFVNGRPIHEATRLRNGDLVRLCDVELIYTDNDGSSLSESGLSNKSSQASINRVIVSDAEQISESYTVKRQIELSKKKPVLTSANAAVKLQAMIDIGRNIGASVDQVVPQLVENLLKIFPQADCAFIMLTSEQTNRLELKGFQHRDPNNLDSFSISRSILEKVAASKAAVLSDDVSNDSRFDMSESIVSYNIYSIMAAPIMDYDQSEVLGVIQVDARSRGQRFTYEDLDMLVALAYQVAVTYQNAKLHEVAIAEQIMEREMNIANTVQRGLLPQHSPVIENYGFFDFYRPAKYLGGDYYDYIQLADGRLVFALGDVSGKGVAASLLMAKLSAEVRGGLIIETSFEDTMKRLNRTFCDPRWDNRFITFFFGVLDQKTNEIVFHNAGHVPPILFSPDGTVEMLGDEIIGLPLGVMEDTVYPEYRLTLQAGQKLIVISDGITDAMNAKGEYFMMDGVVKFLKDSQVSGVEEFGTNLISAVHSFAGRTPQSDDQSMIVVGRNP
ncbi:MAG: SpoIIE family protein phosphatase [Planctomycetaceae bacterium]|jgi:serine phosphatase RsbU (regulator of sigma subunit)/pSer/pThr/pTyr-binding forkhead associated (FHA) protein|nr:SpoIIE family protein phosphatase [Planctomycetaceae bacterium]